jgi:hypothetical protein
MPSEPLAAAGPSRSAGRRYLRAAAVTLAYLALTLWWLWPLPARMADHATYPVSEVPEVAADFHLITWALAWDTHALLTRPSGLFDANIFHPAPRSLAFSEHFLGYVPLFAPTYLATGNPILASNALLLLTFPLCALAAYAFARRFVSAPAAFVAGALFAFGGLRYHQLYHFHQLGTFYLPLALLLTERWLERARVVDALLLAATVALQLLSSFYLGYALALLYVFYLPLALVRWRAALDRRRLGGLASALAVAAVPALLLSIPYLDMQRLGLVPSSRGEDAVPYTMEPRLTMLQIRRYLTSNGVGPVGYLLALVALASGWRSGAYPRLLGLLACTAGLVLAAGPRLHLFGRDLWSPYLLLWQWLPGFAAVRLPFRLLVVAQLGFALLAALGLERVLALVPRRLGWAAAAAATGLALAALAPLPPHVLHRAPTGADAPPVYRWLRDHGRGGVLLELPPGDAATSGRRMVLGTEHWLPMIDGYSAYPPRTRNHLRRIAQALPEAGALQALANVVDVRWVLVHLDELDARARRAWEGGSVPGLDPVGRWGDDLLFSLTLAPSDDRRALFASTDRTLGGVPLAPIGERCPGRIEAVLLDQRRQLPAGARVGLALMVHNASDVAWPGLGLYPRHLVQLRAGFVRDGRAVGPPAITPLWGDVPAGDALAMTSDVVLPEAPGAYELELALVQDDVPLARCGLAPVRLPLRVGAPSAARRR